MTKKRIREKGDSGDFKAEENQRILRRYDGSSAKSCKKTELVLEQYSLLWQLLVPGTFDMILSGKLQG